MQPEWARWLIPCGTKEEQLVEANMIFAVCPSNIRIMPKVISLLGAMHVIVALPPKKNPLQCVRCCEWSHRQENCAKLTRCYHCGSEKHAFESPKCGEERCADGTDLCPHLPRCIVCSGPHETNYENCPLRPIYSKAKGLIKRPDESEASRIRGQQKILRNCMVRDNRLQFEVADQNVRK